MRRSRRAFTLVELLVALAIIAVLLGLTVGVVRSVGQRNELEATSYAVRSLLRRARNASQEARYGAVVELDAERSELRAQLKRSVTRFRFEPDATEVVPTEDDAEGEEPSRHRTRGARSFVMEVEGGVPAVGRYGQGLLFDAERDWARVEDRPVLSPREGVYLACWLYLGDLGQTLYPEDEAPRRDPSRAEEYARAGEPPHPAAERLVEYDPRDPPIYHVVRKGRAYGLAVTAEYELELFLTGPGERSQVTFVSRTRPGTLAPDEWYRVALSFDGRRARVEVDGIPRYHAPVPRHDELPERLARDPAPLSLGDPHPDRGFFGVIDELEVAALVTSERVAIPGGVALVAPEERLRFDVLGQLDPTRHAEPVTFYLSDDPRVLAPAQPGGEGESADVEGTRTRAEAAEENLVVGGDPYERFLGLLPELAPGRVQEITVGRTGLVR